MNGTRNRRIASAVAVAWAGVAIGLGGTGTVEAQAAADTLPPVTLSSTTFRLGDTITLSGTGCLDPDSGSGAGGQVRLFRPSTGGRSSDPGTVDVTITPNVDGTFSGSGTVSQPLDRPGPQTAQVVCSFPSGRGLVREVAIEVVTPTIPPITVQAGTTANYTLPCTIEGGDYGRLGIDLGSGADDGPSLVVWSLFGQESSFERGDVVPLKVPDTIRPGTYRARVSCFITEVGVQAGFVQTVTVTPASAVSSTTAATKTAPKTGTGAASAATPVRTKASYTG